MPQSIKKLLLSSGSAFSSPLEEPISASSTISTTLPTYDHSSDIASMPFHLSWRFKPSVDHTDQLRKIESEFINQVKTEQRVYLWFRNVAEYTFHQRQNRLPLNLRHPHSFYKFDEGKLFIPAYREAPVLEGIPSTLCSRVLYLISHKLGSADLLDTACTSATDPTIRFGNIAAEPDWWWAPINSENFTVAIEVGNSQSNTELGRDTRHWIEHAESPFQICILENLSRNSDKIIFPVWRPANHDIFGSQLRRRHVSAIMTDKLTITPSGPFDPLRSHCIIQSSCDGYRITCDKLHWESNSAWCQRQHPR